MGILDQAPASGRVIKEDGSIVNWANSIDVNTGYFDVTMQNDALSATMQNAVSANGNGTILNTTNYSFAVLDVRTTGTPTYTINFEGTIDGTNYFSFPVVNISLGTLFSTTSSAGQFAFRVAGYQNIRARISGYSGTGTISVVGRASSGGQGHHSVSIANTPSVVAGSNIPQSATVTIANGASLSSTADLAGATLIGIITPNTLDGTVITLQASIDNTNFFNVFDGTGTETSLAVSTNRYIPLNPADYVSFRYLKLRTGTSATGTTQGGSRSITLVYRGV